MLPGGRKCQRLIEVFAEAEAAQVRQAHAQALVEAAAEGQALLGGGEPGLKMRALRIDQHWQRERQIKSK